MLLHESATSYFGIANAYIHCGRIANPTKRRHYLTKRRQIRQTGERPWHVWVSVADRGDCHGKKRVSLIIYDKSDADTVDVKVVQQYVAELGFNLQEPQEQGLLAQRKEEYLQLEDTNGKTD